MISFFIAICIALLLMMFGVLYRIYVGPTPIDRMIAVNIIGAKTTTLIVLVGFIFEQEDLYVDLSLAYAMLNFIASIAASNFIKRRGAKNLWMVG